MDIDTAVDILRTRRRILVFTGAGISTESGIPDFRGPDGVWTRVDPEDFTIDRYRRDPDVRRRSWQMRRDSGIIDAAPNRGHMAITRMWDAGRLIACVTQNIDGLHAAAGMPPEAIIEIHGNVRTTGCLSCERRWPTAEVLDRVAGGEDDPRCTACGGILKVDVVFFRETMPAAEMTRGLTMASVCDAVLAVGSTLSVFPAAQIPLTAVDAGSPLVIVNSGETEFDGLAAALVDAPAGETLDRLAELLA